MVVELVPEEGEFEEVILTFEFDDDNLVADQYWLRVFNPPKGGNKWETERALSFGADKDISDTNVSMLIAYGTSGLARAKSSFNIRPRRSLSSVPSGHLPSGRGGAMPP